MSAPLLLSCLWAIGASLIALGPSRFHWPAAWVLIALGVPLVGWVTLDHGPIVGLLVLAGGISVLRWPVIYLLRAARRRLL
ncbi:hypothetical protein DL1_02880 [Thioclava dalianensis]|uniref:UDP-N-acetylmuramate--alanine ligase n=1 Tax=Thioclava dalianensis TaxID=1185766 RepID=A0A074TKM9_9RHOB|nr:DUF2484 family protein [Thioclava dalianensis]KEP69563.1 hypothetical protein DL1_02880 [Thioclava dalianensis]SFN14550.1 Protein of unknown function [Thioclava dalianensis]